jgi:hypothetical protein
MEEKNNNSGRERSGVSGDFNFKSKVKGDGQECPSHMKPSYADAPCPGWVETIQAVADDNNKRTGEAIEAAFLAKVCGLRIPVCKPWGDSEPYDFVVHGGAGFGRVQVKGGSYCEGSKYEVGTGGSGRPFSKEDMDFVVVLIVPEDLWYVIPVEMVEGLRKLWFNPGSTRARFEKYREAWCLLDCPKTARGREDIPVRCRSEAVKVRCAVCPLRGRVVL